jgi:hypothetical protein
MDGQCITTESLDQTGCLFVAPDTPAVIHIAAVNPEIAQGTGTSKIDAPQAYPIRQDRSRRGTRPPFSSSRRKPGSIVPPAGGSDGGTPIAGATSREGDPTLCRWHRGSRLSPG